MYKLLKDQLTDKVCSVLKDNNMSIPFDPDNTDYQAYLTWVSEGNEPLPAEETI
jgi:hypothetical protein